MYLNIMILPKTINNLTTDLLFISFINIHGNGDGDELAALLTPVAEAK